MKVDTIKQRPADALTVTLDDYRTAPALAFEIAVVTARASLQCLFSSFKFNHLDVALENT